jgi:hypothetical protein
MAPLIVAVIVGASLFGTGTVIKPEAPVAGTILQAAGVGAALGGGIGAIPGVAGAFTVSTASAITTGAVVGGVVGAAAPLGYAATHPHFSR